MNRIKAVTTAVILLFLIFIVFISCDIVPDSALPHSNTVDPVNAGDDSSEDGGSETPVVPVDPVEPVKAPAAPSEPVLLAGGSGTLTVSWTAVSDASSYIVYYDTSSDSSSATAVTSAIDADMTDTEAVITGLTNGTLYYLWVSAVNSGGESAKSALSKCVPVAAGTDHHGADYIITSSPAETIGGTHYNIGTFRMDSGTELNVTHYDGIDSETGMLTIYAKTIDVSGFINANGAGYGGGGGGGGGAGGKEIGGDQVNPGSGGSGVQGSSAGFAGTGNYNDDGENGGRGGDGAGPGKGSGGNYGSGGAGDGSVNGTAGSPGDAGGIANYIATLSTSANEIVSMGSGGGGGGGAGGGGAYDYNDSNCWGGGGSGGGAGGNGGGMIRLISFGSLSVSGTLSSTGSSGGSGAPILTGRQTGGSGGASGGNGYEGGSHGGGVVDVGQGADGGTGGDGGAGSGGGILLKGTDVDLSGGTINCSGGSSNPGETKIFYSGNLTDGTYNGDNDPYKNGY